MVRRHVSLTLASAVVLVSACNAINGAGDLSVDPCPACGGATSGDRSEGGGPDPRTEGGARGDAGADAPDVPMPGGFLDPSFGAGGFVVSALLDAVTSVAVRADGKIVVGGSSDGQLAVARFTPEGAPDPTFGAGGRVTETGSARADAVAVDAQGRVLAAGKGSGVFAGTRAHVVRITDAGGLDVTFAQGGRLVFPSQDEAPTAVAVAPGGEIFVTSTLAKNGDESAGGLWRIDATGALLSAPSRLDVSYGSPNGGGSTATALSVTATDVVVVGAELAGNGDFGAARLAGGAFDSTFDGDGKTKMAVGVARDQAKAVGRLSDGSVVVAGEVEVPPNLGLPERTPQFGFVKLLANGTRDMAWGTKGTTLVKFDQPSFFPSEAGDFLRGLVVDAKNRTVAVGYSFDKSAGALGDTTRADVTRLAADGRPDLLFGQKGSLSFAFGQNTSPARATAVALAPDGRIVVVGTSGGQLGIARITP